MIRLTVKVAYIGEIEHKFIEIVISKPDWNKYAFCSAVTSSQLACATYSPGEQRDALLPRAYLQGKHDNNSVANARQTLR